MPFPIILTGGNLAFAGKGQTVMDSFTCRIMMLWCIWVLAMCIVLNGQSSKIIVLFMLILGLRLSDYH